MAAGAASIGEESGVTPTTRMPSWNPVVMAVALTFFSKLPAAGFQTPCFIALKALPVWVRFPSPRSNSYSWFQSADPKDRPAILSAPGAHKSLAVNPRVTSCRT
jgi:hypothetical protein